MIIIDEYWLLLMIICYYWWLFVSDNYYVDKSNFSSSVNEVIRAVLNFLYFFYDKISQLQKSIKKH